MPRAHRKLIAKFKARTAHEEDVKATRIVLARMRKQEQDKREALKNNPQAFEKALQRFQGKEKRLMRMVDRAVERLKVSEKVPF